MHFYKEPGRYAIEQVLSRKDIGQCEIKTPSCHLIFKLESVSNMRWCVSILVYKYYNCKLIRKSSKPEKCISGFDFLLAFYNINL